MSRAPVFFFKSVDDTVRFYQRVPELEPQLKKDAKPTIRFAKLISLTPHLVRKTVHVHFEFETGDAAGQNMTEIATVTAITKFLDSKVAKEAGLVKANVEGHVSNDKIGASARGIRNPRGVSVQAWGTLTDEVCRMVLRRSTGELHQALFASKEGDIRTTNEGNSVSISNPIAGMFIATGQDAVSVVESSWAHLTMEYDAESTKDITFTMFMPSLIVGSVGGGTVYRLKGRALR